MKGNCESSAIFAAKAVFPLCGGPGEGGWGLGARARIYCLRVFVCVCEMENSSLFQPGDHFKCLLLSPSNSKHRTQLSGTDIMANVSRLWVAC